MLSSKKQEVRPTSSADFKFKPWAPIGQTDARREIPYGSHERACTRVNKFADPQTDKATGKPVAAMCVRKSSVRRVLQFTLFIGASSVLHRPVSRVIHRLQLYCFFFFKGSKSFSSARLEGGFRSASDDRSLEGPHEQTSVTSPASMRVVQFQRPWANHRHRPLIETHRLVRSATEVP